MSAEEQQTADLISGNIKLDPENDPVICTTESGLEIKYAMAIDLGSGNKYTNSLPAGSATTPSGLSGYAYLKMGNYNWIIIGYNYSSTSVAVNYNFDAAVAFSTYLASPSTYKSFAGSFEKSTDAGAVIANAGTKGLMWGKYALSTTLNFSKAVKNTSELSSGEALVMCEGGIDKVAFNNSKADGSNYTNSNLQSVMNTYYSSGCGFTDSEKSLIVSKTLTTMHYTTSTSTQNSQKLFPLAGRSTSSENFCFQTYLTSDAIRKIETPDKYTGWWLRSGAYWEKENACPILSDGDYGSRTGQYYAVTSKIYARPAMVIKI